MEKVQRLRILGPMRKSFDRATEKNEHYGLADGLANIICLIVNSRKLVKVMLSLTARGPRDKTRDLQIFAGSM